MPRGDKSSYTSKQKRQAEHIEKGYEKRGLSEKEAERRAWATVNKQTGGGKRKSAAKGESRRSSKSKTGGSTARSSRSRSSRSNASREPYAS